MAKRKKVKVNGKAIGIGLAVLLGIGAVSTVIDGPPETAVPDRSSSRTVAVAEITPSPVPTSTPVPTPTPYRIHGMDPQRTVYVSNSGVIHIENDCSGMKHYTEMTLEKADAAGYSYCSKCIW